MTSIHLGFDMGIRNLAYCLIRHTGDVWNIEAWDNIDLLEGGTSSQDAKRCVACTSPAKWIGPDAKKWCQACATGVRRKKTATEKPELQTLPCDCSVKALRALATAGGSDAAKRAKKDELLAWAAARYLMPWKPAKAMDSSLQDIRRAMDTWLNSVLPTFRSATLIRLENQPVMKGPTMKSVQIILFTLLSHRLEREYGWTGAIEFVHAGVKTKEAEGRTPAATAAATAPLNTTAEESAAYRARKKTAETEVIDILTKGGEPVANWLAFFNGRSKKSDLADAFLMAMRR
jgi:hypothetical protein